MATGRKCFILHVKSLVIMFHEPIRPSRQTSLICTYTSLPSSIYCRMASDIRTCRTIQPMASGVVIRPAASGRFFVRATFRSMSRSTQSSQTMPAPQKAYEAKKHRAVCRKTKDTGTDPGSFASFVAPDNSVPQTSHHVSRDIR